VAVDWSRYFCFFFQLVCEQRYIGLCTIHMIDHTEWADKNRSICYWLFIKMCWVKCHFKWNVKWVFARLTFCHSTMVTLDTQWQNACMFLERISYTTYEPGNFSISRGPGLSWWLHVSTETREIFCCVWTDRGRPLPAFRLCEPFFVNFS